MCPHKNVVNLCITFELDIWSRDLNKDFRLINCLFGALKLTKNADSDKYGHRGYGIGFDARSQFSCSDSSWVNMLLFLVLI